MCALSSRMNKLDRSRYFLDYFILFAACAVWSHQFVSEEAIRRQGSVANCEADPIHITGV